MEWWNYLIAGGAALIGFIVKWLLDKYGNKYAQAALQFLNDAIVISVTAVNQVYVDAIRAAKEDGVLTDEEKAAAKKMALEFIWSQIPAKFIDALKKMFGSEDVLASYVDKNIEAAVKDIKDGSL